MMDSGLAGVVVTETVLSHSDGARGILWVRGHTLRELAANFGYDGAVGLLWESFAGDRLTSETMRSSLGRARERAFARLADWLDRAEQRPLAEGMRLALASLPEDSTPARNPQHLAGRGRCTVAPPPGLCTTASRADAHDRRRSAAHDA